MLNAIATQCPDTARIQDPEDIASRAFDLVRAIAGIAGNPEIIPDRHDRDAIWRLTQLLEADLEALGDSLAKRATETAKPS